MNESKVYVLFETDVWMTKTSYVFCGVFKTKSKAHKAAKDNGLVTYDIVEVELDKFEEL